MECFSYTFESEYKHKLADFQLVSSKLTFRENLPFRIDMQRRWNQTVAPNTKRDPRAVNLKTKCLRKVY